MENAAKALEIAAGALTAILIMSLIAYFFSTARLSPLEEDSRDVAEQLAKFNLEYEVYDKKAMYGADVISCLTKAQSNNEKYVEGQKYLTGSEYGPTYWKFIILIPLLVDLINKNYYQLDKLYQQLQDFHQI